MANLTSINLTLSQSLTQEQETILVNSKQLQELQVQTKAKTPATKRTSLDKKKKDAKSNWYWWTHGRTHRLDHTSTTYSFPKTGHWVGKTFGIKMGGSENWFEEYDSHKYYGGARNTIVDKINYNHNISLIQTLTTSIIWSSPRPHTNGPISESGCTLHYLDTLTKIVHTREPLKKPINVKIPNSSAMAFTHQSQIPPNFLSNQAKHAEIFPNLHSSLISIGKLCDDEFIVTFDNHKYIVSKNKDIIIEGYQDPTNGLWQFPIYHPAQNNKQANILEPHLYNHSRPMAQRHPRLYQPTSQKYLENFYHQIFFWVHQLCHSTRWIE